MPTDWYLIPAMADQPADATTSGRVPQYLDDDPDIAGYSGFYIGNSDTYCAHVKGTAAALDTLADRTGVARLGASVVAARAAEAPQVTSADPERSFQP